MKAHEAETLTTNIYSLTGKYRKGRNAHTRIKELERFLNVAMAALMVIAIRVLLLLPTSYGRGLSIIIFSTSIIPLIGRFICMEMK